MAMQALHDRGMNPRARKTPETSSPLRTQEEAGLHLPSTNGIQCEPG